MPVVPFGAPQQPGQPPLPTPPTEPFALMAAAQMHSEGRLITNKPDLSEFASRSSDRTSRRNGK
jgi:hypothetical protein